MPQAKGRCFEFRCAHAHSEVRGGGGAHSARPTSAFSLARPLTLAPPPPPVLQEELEERQEALEAASRKAEENRAKRRAKEEARRRRAAEATLAEPVELSVGTALVVGPGLAGGDGRERAAGLRAGGSDGAGEGAELALGHLGEASLGLLRAFKRARCVAELCAMGFLLGPAEGEPPPGVARAAPPAARAGPHAPRLAFAPPPSPGAHALPCHPPSPSSLSRSRV